LWISIRYLKKEKSKKEKWTILKHAEICSFGKISLTWEGCIRVKVNSVYSYLELPVCFHVSAGDKKLCGRKHRVKSIEIVVEIDCIVRTCVASHIEFSRPEGRYEISCNRVKCNEWSVSLTSLGSVHLGYVDFGNITVF